MNDVHQTPSLDTPVLLIAFNRPDTTRRVFEAIRAVRPRQLLISADGPRNDAEAERCNEVRAIVDEVDWPCSVATNFYTENKRGPWACSGGISWAFEQVEQAIILEDDCLPDPSFFYFCQALLDRYADDDRVMHICGSNFIPGGVTGPHSYHFSKYATAWGWATWRRAWRHFDLALSAWPAAKSSGLLRERFASRAEQDYWTYFFARVHNGESVHWDYAWKFACLNGGGVTIVPNVNLVSNIGFGEGATHTRNQHDTRANRTAQSIDVTALAHPDTVAVDTAADADTFRHRYAADRRPPLKRFVAQQRRRAKNVLRTALEYLPEPLRLRIIDRLVWCADIVRLGAARARHLVAKPALPQNSDGRVMLHLGCGPVNHPGFINVDLWPRRHIHYLRPIDDLAVFETASADLVYACHCLEHFSHARVPAVLREWQRVLRSGGVLRLSVPDFDCLLTIYRDSGERMEAIVKALMGGQDYRYNVHFTAFNRAWLTALLYEAGFSEVREWQPGASPETSIEDWSGKTIVLEGRDYPVSLNLEAVK